MKIEKNEQFVQLTRELEEANSAKRQVQSELERNEFKLKASAED